jgi:hypothetical protein
MRVLTVSLLSLCVGACTAVPPSSYLLRDGLRADLLGCWQLQATNGAALRMGGAFHQALVRLDSFPVFGTESPSHPGVLRVVAQPGWDDSLRSSVQPHDTYGPNWAVDSLTDSLRIDFSLGLGGQKFVLDAILGADTLVGIAGFVGDIVGDAGSTVTSGPPVRAVRVQCPTSPRAAT